MGKSSFGLVLVVLALIAPGMSFAGEKAAVSGEGSLAVQQGWIDPLLSREVHRAWTLRQDVRLRFVCGAYLSGWQSAPLESESSADAGHLELGWIGEPSTIRFSTALHHGHGSVERLEQVADVLVWAIFVDDDEAWDLRLRAAWVSPSSFQDGVTAFQPYVRNAWSEAFGFGAASLEQDLTVSQDGGFKDGKGIDNNSRGIFFRWEVGLKYKLADHISLAASYEHVFPLRRADDGRGEADAASGGIEIRF